MVRDLFTQKITVTPYLNMITTYDDARFFYNPSWDFF